MRCVTKKLKILLFVSSLLIVIIIIFKFYGNEPEQAQLSIFDNFNNETGAAAFLVPNVVHYVIFQQNIIDFVTFLSIKSVISNHKPSHLYIHCNNCSFYGLYWNKLQQIQCNTTITLSYLAQPTHVYGQPLSSVYHATDIARIQVLRLFGGIYLDNDVIVLKSLDQFRKFEMTVGWPDNQNFGTQILIAHRDARFLLLWLQSYQRYRPTDWYYNAGQKPTEKILISSPFLVHRVRKYFGVHNLLGELHSTIKWDEWQSYYALHLLSRHPPTPEVINDIVVERLKTPFGNISRLILHSQC